MNELASLMIRDSTTVKRQLDRLVDQKFVKRSASTEDGRVVMVELTHRGRKRLRAVLPMLEWLAKIYFGRNFKGGLSNHSNCSAHYAGEFDP